MRAITIGVFDGVHVGHAYIVKKMVEHARKLNLKATALIFAMPYDALFKPKDFYGLLTAPSERSELLKNLGIEEVIVKDLRDIFQMDAMDFIKMLINDMKVRSIYVGHDFKFGNGARGNAEMLNEIGKREGFEVTIIPKIVKNGNRVSSSLIRYELKIGKPEVVPTYLGRYFSISGKVVRERGIGTKIGFPTANLNRPKYFLLVPKHGVYMVRSMINGKIVHGVMNIGTRPTTADGNGKITYEIHFFERGLNLIGRDLKVELLCYMRPEFKFSNLLDLKDAIDHDVKVAKSMLNSTTPLCDTQGAFKRRKA